MTPFLKSNGIGRPFPRVSSPMSPPNNTIWESAFSIAAIQITIANFSNRHTPAIKPTRKAAGYRHAWLLKFDWIGRREEAILKVPAGFSLLIHSIFFFFVDRDGLIGVWEISHTRLERVFIFPTPDENVNFY